MRHIAFYAIVAVAAGILLLLMSPGCRRERPAPDWLRVEHLARDLEEILRPKAAEQQKRKPEFVSAKLPKQNPIDTRKEAAKVAGVRERDYDSGERPQD